MDSALITGGSGGIGGAVAQDLASKLGLHIVIGYKSNLPGAESAQSEIEKIGRSCEILNFDITNPEETRRVLETWISSNPDKQLKVLVNNAGIHEDKLFPWMSFDDWQNVLDVNLNGFFHVTKMVLPEMMKFKYGRIINISSTSGQQGTAGQVNYSAAKAGLIGATKALSKEVARMNITVNSVAPGYIETEMLGEVDQSKILPFIPVKRLGRPEEVAAVVRFLASPEASYITGEVISVNGGLYS